MQLIEQSKHTVSTAVKCKCTVSFARKQFDLNVSG